MVMKFWNWYGGMHRQRFFCFAFLFISLQYLMFCYATFYFSTDTFHIILPIFSFFFFPSPFCFTRKITKKKNPTESRGVKRIRWLRSISALRLRLYTFRNGIEQIRPRHMYS